MSGAGAPAVRPQHVQVSVEEKHVEVRVHDARKARSRESIKPAMVDETRTAKLYPSLRLKEDPSHAPAVKDETLQDATESPKDRVKRKRRRRSRRSSSGQTEKLHTQDKARESEIPRMRRRKPSRTLRSRL